MKPRLGNIYHEDSQGPPPPHLATTTTDPSDPPFVRPEWALIVYNNPCTGMIGLDGRGWPRIASREAPTSKNQCKKQVPTALATLLFLSPHKRVIE